MAERVIQREASQAIVCWVSVPLLRSKVFYEYFCSLRNSERENIKMLNIRLKAAVKHWAYLR